MNRASTLFLALLVGLVGLFCIGFCQKKAKTNTADRPNDPFIFRSVLDKKPRMITLALSDDLWAAYSTDSCSLYKVWRGGVDFDGAVYTMAHGPQPMSIGKGWTENQSRSPWRVEIAGRAAETPRTDWRGHRVLANGRAELFYDLVLADGQKIRVNERPEFVRKNGQVGFERAFSIENAPAGAKISLETNAQSLADASALEVCGGLFSKKSESAMPTDGENFRAVVVTGTVGLAEKGETTITTFFVNHPLIANPNDAEKLAEASRLTPAERLINRSDCRTCHNPTEKTVGPSYAEIAKKYLNTPENLTKLTQKVKLGGAGVWGAAAMSAHPTLVEADIRTIVGWILEKDKTDDEGEGRKDIFSNSKTFEALVGLEDSKFSPGLVGSIFLGSQPLGSFKNWNEKAKPAQVGVTSQTTFLDADLAAMGLTDNFQAQLEGFLNLPSDREATFEIASDDGSRLLIDDQLVIDNDGFHGMDQMTADVLLKKGLHRIRVDYWQGGGGRGLTLKWANRGTANFEPIPSVFFQHLKTGENEAALGGDKAVSIPGDGLPLKKVHPSFTLAQARPDWFLPKVGGMDFDSKGNLYVSTWDATGSVYRLENVKSGDPAKIKCTQIAKGLAEPLGVKVFNDELFVLQKQELTRLRDLDGDGVMDEYDAFARGWRASANFHEFAFGLAEKDGFFYATLATAINPGGASTRPQISDRGKVMKIDAKTGEIEFIANGLRTPNGVGVGPDGEVFVADNQGDWLPSSKILHVKKGAFYNSYSVDSAANASKTVQQPVAWLPQDEIGNSPTQPMLLNVGPYKNQLIFGDVCYGGLQRLSVEKVNGDYQGCVFRFTQGLEGGTNRLAQGPDGSIYVGMIGNPGNWGQSEKLWYGLQKLTFNEKSTFEMLAVRAKSDGLEIEFTEPLAENEGWNPEDFAVDQWRYQPTIEYGGPKIDQKPLAVTSATVLEGGKKVHLKIDGVKSGHVVHLKLRGTMASANDQTLWQTEAWYTMNAVPSGQPVQVLPQPAVESVGDNELSKKEKRDGFRLLFDGKSLAGWRNFKKTDIGPDWIIDQNAMHLAAKQRADGSWQAKGGDLISAEEFENFELRLDWKIGPCGNSGLFWNVSEDAEFDYGWQTGPEMQVLDNACHPDAKIEKHRAGDLYDMIACEYETVRPAGEWNQVRLISKNGHVQQWLNGRKVVEYTMFTPEWRAMIAGSKFAKMQGFGMHRKGHLSLQDHGDPVWFKNVRVRTF